MSTSPAFPELPFDIELTVASNSQEMTALLDAALLGAADAVEGTLWLMS